jgi:SAM-dependent methyltransferase
MEVVETPDNEPALSFGSAADAYDRARPPYPDAAVDWLLDGVDGSVVDIGAGTGKLTASLAERRDDVLTVEPDPAMRAVLEARIPRIEVRKALRRTCHWSTVRPTSSRWRRPGTGSTSRGRPLRSRAC